MSTGMLRLRDGMTGSYWGTADGTREAKRGLMRMWFRGNRRGRMQVGMGAT